MTITVDEGEHWLAKKVTKILNKCYRRGIKDASIVKVFGELLDTSQESAEAVLNTLKELRGEEDLDGEDDPSYG